MQKLGSGDVIVKGGGTISSVVGRVIHLSSSMVLRYCVVYHCGAIIVQRGDGRIIQQPGNALLYCIP